MRTVWKQLVVAVVVLMSMLMVFRVLFLVPQRPVKIATVGRAVLPSRATPSGPADEISVGDAVRELRHRVEELRGPVEELLQRLESPTPQPLYKMSPNHALVYHERRGSIFVIMSSYRDPLCADTIINLFGAAKEPSAIHVGLVEQHSSDTPACISEVHRLCNLSSFCPTDQIRHRRIPTQAAKGVSWARAVAAAQYRGEQFVLVVDSHTIFTPHWDEVAIAQLLAAERMANGATPVLTYQPSWRTVDGAAHAGEQIERLCRFSFAGKGLVNVEGRAVPLSTNGTRSALMISSHFFFTDAKVLALVPFDPTLEFVRDGVDFLYAARLWTSGFDFFEPSRHLVFRRLPSGSAAANSTGAVLEDVAKAVWGPRQAAAKERIARLLRADRGSSDGGESTVSAAAVAGGDAAAAGSVDQYGLGAVRLLPQFEMLRGLDVAKSAVTKDLC